MPRGPARPEDPPPLRRADVPHVTVVTGRRVPPAGTERMVRESSTRDAHDVRGRTTRTAPYAHSGTEAYGGTGRGTPPVYPVYAVRPVSRAYDGKRQHRSPSTT
jgi:hypothetical protein